MNVPERKAKLKRIQNRLDAELPRWVTGFGSLASNGGFDIRIRRVKFCDTEIPQIIRIVDGIMQEEGCIETK